MATRLFTVTTNSFNSYDILSDKTKDDLEYEYKEVTDHGEVTVVEENNEKVIFIHNRNRKSLPADRLCK